MHTLFCGVTRSGKTTLAKAIARALPDDARVIVYDPVSLPRELEDWNATLTFRDFDSFMLAVSDQSNYGAHLFIDEAGEWFTVGQREHHWLLTRGRHYGYAVNLIAQRPKMLAPTVRTQCGRAYVFRLAIADADEIGRDLGFDSLSQETLDKGDFLIVDSGSPSYSRHNVFRMLERDVRSVTQSERE